MAPRVCVRVYARELVLVPPNLYIHTYIYTYMWAVREGGGGGCRRPNKYV